MLLFLFFSFLPLLLLLQVEPVGNKTNIENIKEEPGKTTDTKTEGTKEEVQEEKHKHKFG